eukprot:gene3907-13977_t
MANRSTSTTKLNGYSSRSHAIFTITVHRTIVEVLEELGEDFSPKTRTRSFSSKLHLVDLAGPCTNPSTIVEVLEEMGENFMAKTRTSSFSRNPHLVDLAGSKRVKRSGITGKELKEATHINRGLVALADLIAPLPSYPHP